MKNTKTKANGITEGIIWQQILLFFFPIMFGTLFMTLYNTVDAIIVGQLLGKEALAAVSGGTTILVNLIIGFFTGVSSGATVIISQFYGAKDDEKVSKSIHTAIGLSIIFGLLISIGGFLLTEPLLKLIDTPLDVLPLASKYLHVYFSGALVLIVYNMASGIYRAFGDSKHPLWFLIAGAFVNIFLDILFIAIFKRGVRGAAEATVISQVVSLFLTLLFLCLRKDSCKYYLRRSLDIDAKMLKRMLEIGLPGGIQSIMYNISNMIIQTNVNHFGTDTAAAWASYNKLDSIFWMIINAFGIAATTFVGQNYGAGKIDRAKKGVKISLYMAGSVAIVMTGLYLAFGQYAFRLFTSDEEVIAIGMRILRTIAPVFVLYIPIEILSGALRGVGKTLVPTLFTVFGICGLRIVWLSIPFCTTTIERVMLSYAISWGLVSILFFIYYNAKNVYNEKRAQKSSL